MSTLTERVTDIATIACAASAVAVTVFVLTGGSSREARPTINAPQIEDWEVYAETGHRRGTEDASVLIVEFGDYECPFCRAAEARLAEILRESDGEVALLYRHNPLPLHARGLEAAIAAECAAEQGVFWPFHDRLYADDRWRREDARRTFVEFARDAGVSDESLFAACLDEEEPRLAVSADQAAATAIGLTGTPGFLINGQRHLGATILDSPLFEEVLRQVR